MPSEVVIERTKKVLFVHHGGAQGGAPLSLLYLLNELKEHGHMITVLNTRCDPRVNELYEQHGHCVTSAKIPSFSHTENGSNPLRSIKNWIQFFLCSLRYPLGCFNLYCKIKAEKPEIVHFNSLVLAPYLFVSSWFGAKTVLHVRESMVQHSRRSRWMRHAITKYCDRVIAICQANADALRIAAGKVVIVYNPIDLNRFKIAADSSIVRAQLGIEENAFVVMFPGGANGKIKGIEDFCKAMLLLKKRIPELYCLLPGAAKLLRRESDSPLKEALRNIEPFAEISDFTYDIEQWFAASNVVCALHIKDHFSRSQIEALVMKRPFIGYNVGEIQEIIDASGCGVGCTSGDIDGVVDACLAVYGKSPDSFRGLDSGAEWAEQNCSAGGHASNVMDVYSRL